MVSRSKAAPKALSIGLQIDNLFQLRERLREIQQMEKDQNALIEGAEAVLAESMNSEGLEKSSGRFATVSFADSIVANVTDWDEFWKFIAKKKYFHLVQKRASDPGVRELFEQGMSVPGVEPFKKRTLKLRKT